MNNLTGKTLTGFAQLIVALGVALFAPAWTLDFPQAWVYLFIFAASSALITVYLWKNDPKLLERRVKAGPAAEKERSQQLIQLLAAIAFIGILAVPSLDHRFAWSDVPIAVVIVGDILVAVGFFIVFLVFKENPFTAATIDVAGDQRVISTGPYAMVRHPMYSGALVMLFGTPLALGSWWGLLPFIVITVAIVVRLLDEEKFLGANLPGYTEYRRKVRYRLIPFIW
jgi:protein-S-isoprenylcysteine O-methyltransferase Ste14